MPLKEGVVFLSHHNVFFFLTIKYHMIGLYQVGSLTLIEGGEDENYTDSVSVIGGWLQRGSGAS